jgi:hypothetical protein
LGALEELNSQIHVRDLVLPAGVGLVTDADEVVALAQEVAFHDANDSTCPGVMRLWQEVKTNNIVEARGAIVVDGRSDALRHVYDEVSAELQGSFRRGETMPVQAILLKVMHKVQEVMPYDGPNAERISYEHHGDKLVGLSTFLKEKAGVCRHQCLLAAYIIFPSSISRSII